jgi:hypothetical protein
MSDIGVRPFLERTRTSPVAQSGRGALFSPTNSGAQPRGCRWRQQRLAFVVTMCLSSFSPPSSISWTNARSDNIYIGLTPHSTPLMRWPFLADIPTTSPGAMRTVCRKATDATSTGSSKQSGIMIPTTSSGPLFHCRSRITSAKVLPKRQPGGA